MADLQLKIIMGDVDVNLQGEGELVYKIFKELREDGLGALYNVKSCQSNLDKNGHIPDKLASATAEEQLPERKIAKSKKKSTAKQPQLIKDLDLSGRNVEKSLKTFVDEKKPSMNIERTAVFVYYLQNLLQIQEITIDHVFSCYKDIGVRLPQNLQQNLNDTASSKYGYIEVNSGKYAVSILGTNLVEHDLPPKEKQSKG